MVWVKTGWCVCVLGALAASCASRDWTQPGASGSSGSSGEPSALGGATTFGEGGEGGHSDVSNDGGTPSHGGTPTEGGAVTTQAGQAGGGSVDDLLPAHCEKEAMDPAILRAIYAEYEEDPPPWKDILESQYSLRIAEPADLTGLTCFKGLVSLAVTDAVVPDWSPLGAPTSLAALTITGGNLVDLAPLAALTNLASLRLGDLSAGDLTPLAALAKLERVSLGSLPVSDLSPIAAALHVSVLTLSDLDVADLSPLSALTEMRELELLDLLATNLTGLSTMTKLERLHVNNVPVTDLSALSGTLALKQLELYRAAPADFAPLSQLPDLEVLRVRESSIPAQLPAFSGFPALVELWFERTPLQRLPDLTALPSLESLYVEDNELTSLDGIEGLPLRFITTFGNPLSDLSAVATLPELIDLHTGKRFDEEGPLLGVDLSPLGSATSLRGLHLDAVDCSDLSFLDALPSLLDLQITRSPGLDLESIWNNASAYEILDLTNNGIASISGIGALHTDVWLRLVDNQLSDISPLLASFAVQPEPPQLHTGHLELVYNSLDCATQRPHVQMLRNSGLMVRYDCDCQQLYGCSYY